MKKIGSLATITHLLLSVAMLYGGSNIRAQSNAHFDILIVGGHILDGTGNPWIYADIGIRDGKIIKVGRLKGKASGDRVIDATGLTVTPGFIDIHSHAYDDIRPDSRPVKNEKKRRAAPNFVTQGVTTVVTNQDGSSGWPIVEQIKKLESGGIGPNAVLLVGHGTVRHLVMGEDYKRFATKEEIQKMRKLVHQGMEEGAWGLSGGLEYVPGIWSSTDEIVELVEEIVPYGGFYIVHERSAGKDPMWYFPSQHDPLQPDLFQATSETIEIAERTGITAVTTHIKVRGAGVWGASRAVVSLIERARDRAA